MDKFYIVLKDGLYDTARRYPTETEAMTAAERLCKKEGKRFYILETIENDIFKLEIHEY